MSIVLVDTDVVSFIFREDALGDAFILLLENQQAVISLMSFAELSLWPLRSKWGPARKRKLHGFLEDNFGVCFPDEKLCSLWAQVRHEGFTTGQPIESSDAWIAATARYLEVPLMTHNEKHFRHLKGVSIITSAQ